MAGLVAVWAALERRIIHLLNHLEAVLAFDATALAVGYVFKDGHRMNPAQMFQDIGIDSLRSQYTITPSVGRRDG